MYNRDVHQGTISHVGRVLTCSLAGLAGLFGIESASEVGEAVLLLSGLDSTSSVSDSSCSSLLACKSTLMVRVLDQHPCFKRTYTFGIMWGIHWTYSKQQKIYNHWLVPKLSWRMEYIRQMAEVLFVVLSDQQGHIHSIPAHIL